MSSLIFANVLVGSISLLSGSQAHFPQWMNPELIDHFNATFNELLDHNRDGNVNKTELAIGILAQIDAQNIHVIAEDVISFIPEQYSCIPSLDFVDFIDCLSIQTRKELLSINTQNNDDAIISFDDSLASYFGDCADIPPSEFDNEFCEDIVRSNPYLCHQYPSHCVVSCYRCSEHKSETRGVNNAFIPRSE